MKITEAKLKQLIRQIISESRVPPGQSAETIFSRGLDPEKHMERENERYLQKKNKFTFYTNVQPYAEGSKPGEHYILREFVPGDHDFPGQDFWLKDCNRYQAGAHKGVFVRQQNLKDAGAHMRAAHTPKSEFQHVFEPRTTFEEDDGTGHRRPVQGRELVRRNVTPRMSDRSAEMLGGMTSGPNVKFDLTGPYDDKMMQHILTNKDELGYDFGTALDRIRDIE